VIQVLVLSSNRKVKCGIKEYTNRIFNPGYYNENVSVEIKPIGFLNCLIAPFSKAKNIHLQHEFFLFDSLIGITGVFFLLYFSVISIFTKSRLITTVHSVHNPYNLTKALPHFAKFKIIFPLLSLYLKFYYWVIVIVSKNTIVLSKSSADVLSEIAGNLSYKIKVLPHGVFPRLLEESNTNLLSTKFNIPSNAEIFTLFGFAFENKGYHLAIQAIHSILSKNPNSQIHLMVVSGESFGISISGREGETYLEYLVRLTKQLDLQDKVHFTGFLDYDVPEEKELLAEIFTKTFAFIFPYFSRTNASGALASVLSYSKPILVSDIDYFKEYPFLPSFKEGDIQDLEKQIISMNEIAKPLISEIEKYVRFNSLEEIFNQQLKFYS
jgi:glycosyltransferase involved in cell wall biosynthesis